MGADGGVASYGTTTGNVSGALLGRKELAAQLCHVTLENDLV